MNEDLERWMGTDCHLLPLLDAPWSSREVWGIWDYLGCEVTLVSRIYQLEDQLSADKDNAQSFALDTV